MADPAAVNSAAAPARRSWFWPAFIIAVLGGQAVLVLAMVYVATRDPSFAVEPNYYQKALHWDDAAAQIRANHRLGWSARIEIGNDLGPLRERWLSCQLMDAQGRAIEDAQVALTAFAHAQADARLTLNLAPAGGGCHSAKLRFRKSGLWEFQITARRGGETFTYRERRDVHPPGEGRSWPR